LPEKHQQLFDNAFLRSVWLGGYKALKDLPLRI